MLVQLGCIYVVMEQGAGEVVLLEHMRVTVVLVAVQLEVEGVSVVQILAGDARAVRVVNQTVGMAQ